MDRWPRSRGAGEGAEGRAGSPAPGIKSDSVNTRRGVVIQGLVGPWSWPAWTQPLCQCKHVTRGGRHPVLPFPYLEKRAPLAPRPRGRSGVERMLPAPRERGHPVTHGGVQAAEKQQEVKSRSPQQRGGRYAQSSQGLGVGTWGWHSPPWLISRPRTPCSPSPELTANPTSDSLSGGWRLTERAKEQAAVTCIPTSSIRITRKGRLVF